MEMKVSKMSRVVFPKDANQRGILFGGELLAWMDEVAGVTAKRFARSEVITAAVEYMRFYKPIPMGAFLDVIGEVVHVGNTSMKVRIQVMMDNPEGGEDGEADILMADAMFVYVSIDDQGRPVKISRKLES